jgi:hypothetical protein
VTNNTSKLTQKSVLDYQVSIKKVNFSLEKEEFEKMNHDEKCDHKPTSKIELLVIIRN